MIKQVLSVRENLKSRYVELAKKEELDRILDKSGKIIKLSELTILNKEINTGE